MTGDRGSSGAEVWDRWRALFRRVATVGVLVGVGLVAWGQLSISRNHTSFTWPFAGWLDERFVNAFHINNSLAFGVPLFVIGSFLFAIAAPRVGDLRLVRWSDRVPNVSRAALIGGGLSVVMSVAAWAWLNVQLLRGEYTQWYPWLLVISLAVVGGAFLGLDLVRVHVRLRRPRPVVILEVLAIAAVVGTFIGINVRDLDIWRYAAIGDEGPFYEVGLRLLQGEEINLFSQEGPFGYHPVLSSLGHAWSMRVFGDGFFGWKMASVIAIAIMLPAFYLLMREAVGARAAVFGTVVLGASHYLFSYAHTGYNNIFPLFPTVAALAFLLAGLRRASYSLLFASGLFAGLGFYTFFSGRAAIVIVAVVLLTLGRRGLRPGVLAAIGAGFVMMVLPMFAANGWAVISEMLNQSAANVDAPLMERLIENFPRTFLAFNFNTHSQHYTAGALMDGVSATLAVAGLGYALLRVRHLGYRTMVIWFIIAATVAGLFFHVESVAISRLHYALPPMAAFAGIALDRTIASINRILQGPNASRFLTGAALVAVAPTLFILNARQFFIYSAEHSATTPETVVLRELGNAACEDYELRDFVYGPGVRAVLDGLWKFVGRDLAKPLQIEFRDVGHVYIAYPATGGTGCVTVIAPDWDEIAPVIARLSVAPGYRVATDLSGHARVAFIPPVDESGRSATEQIANRWNLDADDASLLASIIKGQEPDALPAIDSPSFMAIEDARLAGHEPVIVVVGTDEARAYPVRFLIWHGVVNDMLDDIAIAVTYDPISAAARVYNRRDDGQVLSFGTSGLLRSGNALLYDRETEHLWQQLTGRVLGELGAEAELESLPAIVSSWSWFQAAFPAGKVLALDPNFEPDRYDRNPYVGYDLPLGRPIFTRAPVDTRLPAMQRVIVLGDGDDRLAVPFPDPEAKAIQVSRVSVGRDPVTLIFDWRVSSNLDVPSSASSRMVGSVSAFSPIEGGQLLSLSVEGEPGERIVDEGTGTRWDVYGRAIEGPIRGSKLEPVDHVVGFWFSVSALYPEIAIVDPW